METLCFGISKAFSANTVPSNTVFFDQDTPTTMGVIFDPDDQQQLDTLYVSTTNSSTWIWDGVAYITYTAPTTESTEFYIAGTTIDAGSSKTAIIERSGEIRVKNGSFASFRTISGTKEIRMLSTSATFNKVQSTGGDFYLSTQDAYNLFLSTTNVERVRILSTGAIRFNQAYTFPTTDGTVGQVLQTDGAGVLTFGSISSSIPQENVIYVDSVNGVNSTGRGNINTPYLTIEYALADITNTGTFTCNTATNTTLSAISDVNYALLKVGQFITGSGIPYGTVIKSKDGGGVDAKSVTLSKATTATASGITATWWTPYTVFLLGSFAPTTNCYKHGFFIDADTYNASITFGALILFEFTSNALVPVSIKLGKTTGTHSSSRLFVTTVGVTYTGVDIELGYGNYYSIGTDYQLGSSGGGFNFSGIVNVYGEMFDARFGYILHSANVSQSFYWKGNAYGLLGGIRCNSTYSTVDGTITTPASVFAIQITGNAEISGNITGSFILSGTACRGVVDANINGTFIDFGSNNAERIVSNGYTQGTMRSYAQLVLNGKHNGAFQSLGVVHLCEATVNSGIIGTVTMTSGSVIYNAYNLGANNTLITAVINAGTFVNKGFLNLVGLTYTGAGTFQNDGDIGTGNLTNQGATILIRNSGKLINNGSINYDKGANEFAPLIDKGLGTFVNNGRLNTPTNLFVTYQTDTSPSKDITIGYAKCNGNQFASSQTGTGTIKRLTITAADLATSVDIFDGTNTVTISTGAGTKPITQIISELITAVQASILEYQFVGSYGGTQMIFIGKVETACTFAVLTNCTDSGTYNGGGGFNPNVLGGGTELVDSNFNY